MTTENLAILFTDIVGSTQLSHLQSPEDADEVRRGHFSILRQAVTEAGGTEVKNLGDGLMAVFGSASTALACAVAMQQGVDQDNRDRLHPAVGLRIGLSGGEVIPEDGDYFGDPVVEAARLCALCDGGQILAADILRLTAGRRSRHQYRALGELTLKGLPDPVECVEVLWEPLGGAASGWRIPLPARMPVRPGSGVIGRDKELSMIDDVAKSIAGGAALEALLISGEAGQGKTTLVAEGARRAFDDGSCVLFGHCEEDLATPYQLFAEALGHFVAHAPEEQLLAHVATHGSELLSLVPSLAGRIPDLPPSKATDSDTERYLLFAAVIGLLAEASLRQPVVLVLDDLQWADKGSLLLLRHIMATAQPMRMLIIGTYRDSELSQTHPLLDTLAALRRQSGVARLELSGLDDSGVVAFMEAIAGYTLDDAAITLGPCRVPRHRRKSILRERTVTTPVRDRNHLPRRNGSLGDGSHTRADGPSEQFARGDRGPGRAGWDPMPERYCRWPRSSVGTSTSIFSRGRAETPEEELLDILDAASDAALVRELEERPRAIRLRPCPDTAHALCGHGSEPSGQSTQTRGRSPGELSAATTPGREWVNWPDTGSGPPIRSI